MKSTIGERLREARENKSLDQATLAAKVGIVTRTLQRWEKGEQVPDGLYITKIAKVASVQASWLLTGEGEMYAAPVRPDNVYPLTPSGRRKVHLVDLPLISAVPAGKVATMFHPDYVDDYVTVDDVKDPGAFALKVKGNSMSPRIEDGDLILVDYAKEPLPGDIVVALINGAAVVKKYLRPEGQLILRSANPKYTDIEVKETDQFQIAGVVLKIVDGSV